jgi:thymidylate synthase (FAD)
MEGGFEQEGGYVTLRNTMGDDRTIVDAARVSYNKRAGEVLSAKDVRLIDFLAENGHTSPFRHAVLQFEVHAPLMVARQWWKYVVGSVHDTMEAWNESSRRYITEEVNFYTPNSSMWRLAPENSKQGSGANMHWKEGEEVTKMLYELQEKCHDYYKTAIAMGICAEQARLFLPAYGLYVRWMWTASLQGVAHFINQRTAEDAQGEIQKFAEAVKELAMYQFPAALSALLGENNERA